MYTHQTLIHALRLGAVSALGLTVAAAAAQTTPPTDPAARQPGQTQPGERRTPVDPKMPHEDATSNERGTVLIPGAWMMGRDIHSSSGAGEVIGSVGDLLISPRHQRIAYVLVSRGGVAGVGAKTYAVPYSAFNWDDSKRALVLPMTKASFESAPALSGDDWKLLMDKERSTPLFEYYKVPEARRDWRNEVSVPATPSSGTGGDGKDGASPSRPGRDDEWNQTALNTWQLLKAGDVRGRTLMSREGSELGTLKDLVVDCPSGRVAFAAVTFGGVLGIGDKMVLVPWDLFRVNAEGKVYATTLSPEIIKAAPRVEHDDWRQLREGTYAPGIYRHFGRDGNWLDRKDSDRVRAMRNDRFPDYDRLYTEGTAVDVTGLVMLVEQTRPMKDMPEVTSVAMTTDDKKSYVIHLAPEWYMKDQGISLKTGDRASFKGRWITVDGRAYLVASQVTPAEGKTWVLRREDGTRAWAWR